MLLPEQVVVYGDCAVNPEPSAAELAEIALQSAAKALQRSSGVLSVGAMLQGLRKPVNNLSRTPTSAQSRQFIQVQG